MVTETPLEIERRNRVRLAVAAYAYEVLNESIMSDGEFDALAMKIEPSMSTGHAALDKFFMDHFDPFTGVWVHKHPDKPGLHRICVQVHKLKYEKKRR